MSRKLIIIRRHCVEPLDKLGGALAGLNILTIAQAWELKGPPSLSDFHEQAASIRRDIESACAAFSDLEKIIGVASSHTAKCGCMAYSCDPAPASSGESE